MNRHSINQVEIQVPKRETRETHETHETRKQTTNMRLQIAIQKSGRLSDESLSLLEKCGLSFARSKNKLFWYGKNLPVDLLFMRDDDIPQLLRDNVCQLGIVGQNVVSENQLAASADTNGQLRELRLLNFGHCRLSLAVPESFEYAGLESIRGKRIATSYPATLRDFLANHDIDAQLICLSGSVEVAPTLGTAELVADIVSTGATLKANQLKEVETVLPIQAGLYRNGKGLGQELEAVVQKLLTRIDGVQQASESKYVLLHAPRSAVEQICELLPGAESPTVLPLEGQEDKVAMHAVCREAVFWDHIEELKDAGASAVLVLPIEKMLA